MLEFGAALPVLLRRLGASPDDQHLVLFEKHVVFLGALLTRRLKNSHVENLVTDSQSLASSVVQLYGTQLKKPKQHFSTHVALTTQRCVSACSRAVQMQLIHAFKQIWFALPVLLLRV